MQLDAEDDETAFYKPPVYQPLGSGNNKNGRQTGQSVVDKARATINDDSD